MQRGPAYTELALHAQLEEYGSIRLVNHLGVNLGTDPEEMLRKLEQGTFESLNVDANPTGWGSDRDYATRVRDVDSHVPARFNANPERLFETTGSAGKLVVFAVG